MAASKQRVEFYEDGFGSAILWMVFSDNYADLVNLGAAVEVDIFDLDTTSEDLDVDTGVYAADEISFTIYEDAVETADDQAALDLLLGAQESTNRVYCALVVNPANPAFASDDEIAFRGQVQPKMSWTDVEWDGEEFDGAIDPLREWSCSAMSYDAQLLLDAKIGELLDDWEEADQTGYDVWRATQVSDRLGWFYRTEESDLDSYGHREARFAQLVHFHTVLDKLLALASPAGVTLALDTTILTQLRCAPARFNSITVKGRRMRYPYTGYFGHPRGYRVFGTAGDSYILRFSNDPGAYGEMYVSWRLLRPQEQEKDTSWVDMTVADLLYGVAMCMGLFPVFEYDTHTSIRVTMKKRSAVQGAAVLIADAADSKGDVEPVAAGSSARYRGVVWGTLSEGGRMYVYDGGFVVDERMKAATDGKRLPLTLGPATCLLPSEEAEDAGKDMKNQWALIPHNSVFYNGPTADDRLTDVYHNRTAITSAIHIHVPGLADNFEGYADGSVGVQGLSTYLPVAVFWAGTSTAFTPYSSMESYINKLFAIDGAAYKTGLDITVPYLFGFKATSAGTRDWRHLRRGSSWSIDGKTFVVVGIERAWRAMETRIRLHATSRFAFSTPTTEDVSDVDNGEEEQVEKPPEQKVQKFPAGEAFSADDAVTLREDGRIYRSRARDQDYSLVKGLALEDYDPEIGDPGRMIRVTVNGRHPLTTPTALPPGQRLFVRTNSEGWNVSHLPLTRRLNQENLFYEIGVVEDEETVVINHTKQFIFV